MESQSVNRQRLEILAPLPSAWAAKAAAVLTLALLVSLKGRSQATAEMGFDVVETSIEDVHTAYKIGRLTARQLVQMYLNRIEEYDKAGPAINSIITINPRAFDEADALDAALKRSGLVGPLHGIPILVKDQADAKGMPTTMGSVLMKDYYPETDAFAIGRLRKAGAIVLGKATLGELGSGDAYGSLFGATKNPYALERTAGGSSGGTGASIAANFATVGVGQEGAASIRRPSTWNSLVGMRPTAGLVSRTGVWDGWPSPHGSLGPMGRNVADVAKVLEVMIGYDPEDPLTASGVGNSPQTISQYLVRDGLRGARLGVIRESIGGNSDPSADDFKEIDAVFRRAVDDLKAAGAEIVDDIVIPDLSARLAKRVIGPDFDANIKWYFRHPNAPYKSRQELIRAPQFERVAGQARNRLTARTEISESEHYQYLLAREELMLNVLKIMADERLDALIYKSIEHEPPLLMDGLRSIATNRGVPSINTYLIYVPAITVPAGFTTNGIPVGITFQGRPYTDGQMIKFAYGYEQATHRRRPPASAPPLAVRK